MHRKKSRFARRIFFHPNLLQFPEGEALDEAKDKVWLTRVTTRHEIIHRLFCKMDAHHGHRDEELTEGLTQLLTIATMSEAERFGIYKKEVKMAEERLAEENITAYQVLNTLMGGTRSELTGLMNRVLHKKEPVLEGMPG